MDYHWQVIDQRKSDLLEIKPEFFQAVSVSGQLYGLYQMNLNETPWENVSTKILRAVQNKIMEATQYKTASVRPLISHVTSLDELRSSPTHIYSSVDWLTKLTSTSSARTLDTVLMTNQER